MESKQTWGWQKIVLVVFAAMYFLGTLVLTSRADLFVSPDETANAFFAKRFAETGTMQFPEAMNGIAQGLIHPRSVVVNGTHLVPGSFLGLPFYYGILDFFLGDWILPFLTAILFLFAACAWHKLVERWFPRSVAFVSTILLLVHPAFWYYSARGLMHNVLFVCLLIFASYFLFLQPVQKHLADCPDRIGKLKRFQKNIDWILSGWFLGSALFVRTSEVYWVIPLFVVLTVLSYGRMKTRGIIVVIISGLIALLPMWILQWKTYGNPFVTAYTFATTSASTFSINPSVDFVHQVYRTIFPFGLHFQTALQHISSYGSSLFWWLTIPTIVGCLVLIARGKKDVTHRIYLGIFLLLALWLGVWYGSWVLYDNPDPTQITIANSYIRYWLPLFLLSTPLIATTLVWISSFAKTKLARGFCFSIFLILIVWMNIRIVFFDGPDALLAMRSVLDQSRTIRSDVFSIVLVDAVIIVERSDKIFFPERRVILNLRSEKTLEILPELFAQSTPVFYYGITLTPDDFSKQDIRLLSIGLKLELIKTYQAESLYRIIRT